VAGGRVLANVCAALLPNGVVAACGLAAGMEFPATVAPFILRGVSLLGIDSVYRPRNERLDAWRELAELVDPARLEEMIQEIPLSDAVDAARRLLDGEIRGRVVVRI
jgi:acrylyl-CoA reductase (NADPH)